MPYKKRNDGRGFEDSRPIEAKAGVIKNADGSAMFRIGNTMAYAAVYGPRDLYPRFLQNPQQGVLRCRYNMMPFSGFGERVRPGGSRRSKEISYVTEKSLLPVINLEDFPNTVVDVFIELTETDAGSRCAGICAASMALADAGIPMRDIVTAVSAGKVGKNILIDLDYSEEAIDDEPVADMPVAMLPRTKEVVLLQMDGQLSEKELADALVLVQKAIDQIANIQREALKAKFADGDRNVIGE